MCDKKKKYTVFKKACCLHRKREAAIYKNDTCVFSIKTVLTYM